MVFKSQIVPVPFSPSDWIPRFPRRAGRKECESVKFEFDRICFQILEWDDMERHIFVRMACPKENQNQHCPRLETLSSGSQSKLVISIYLIPYGYVWMLSPGPPTLVLTPRYQATPGEVENYNHKRVAGDH